MGYMKQLDNIFVILILALVCSILPTSVMMFIGFAMMIGHCYAVSVEVAGFMLVLILFMMILFLRFSKSQNLVLWVQRSGPSSVKCRFAWQRCFSTSGRMWSGDLLFYPFCSCTVCGA